MRSDTHSPLPAKVPCEGGLPALDHDTIALLNAAGEVVLANGCQVRTYQLHGQSWRADRDWEFPEVVTALADTRAGLIVAAGGHIHCATPEGVRTVARVEGTVRSLTGAGTGAYAAVGREGRLDGSLIEIDLLQSVIVSERSLRSSRVTLSTDDTNTFLGIGDGETFQVVRMASTRPCPPVMPAAEPPHPAPTEDPCHCKARNGENDGTQTPGAEQPPSRPAVDPCDPGQTGVPTPDGGRIVRNGAGVTKHPPGAGRPWDPCRSHLFFQVESIRQAGSYIVATDREARNVAVLAAGDLQVLHQAQFRKGAVVLSHPAQPRMLVYDRRSSAWSDTAFNLLVRLPIDHIPQFDPALLAEPNTFTGSPMNVLRGTRAPATGVKKVLMLPVVDPGQAFNDADLPRLTAYLRRTAFSHVAEYYREVSFNMLKDIQFAVYGVDVGPGGPLRLPRPISAYYNPPYVGAHVDMIKSGLTFPASIVFDGRESMTLNVQPQTGGQPASVLNVKFSAILASGKLPLYPAQVHFGGTERATIFVKRPDGSSAALNLVFPPLTIDIASDSELATKLPLIEAYLDGVIATAETSAGIPARLFTKPAIRRVFQDSPGPGLLVTTLSHSVATGVKLEVISITYSGATDSLGLKSAFTGKFTITTGNNISLQAYLDFVTVLAQEAAGFDVNRRRLATDPVLNANTGTLTSQLFISQVDGGPGAAMSVSNPVNMDVLFDTVNSVPNTNVTAGRSNTPKDGNDGFDGLVDDAFTAAVDRLAPPGKHLEKKLDIAQFFQDYEAVFVGIVHPPKADAAEPNTVRPDEIWSAGATSWHDFRAMEGPRTGHFRPNPTDIQFFSNWNIAPLEVPPSVLMLCHEFGHALGFGDLYKREAGYRDDLLYMGNWSMMDNHDSGSHHCGYHKWQAGWITDSRVKTVLRPPDDNPVTTEVLLVPVEFWPDGDAIIGQARAAFGMPQAEVAQLIELELGGDGDVFGLIEARQKKGLSFSQSLPAEPALLVTNCIVFWDPNRYAFEHRYRASVHPLHQPSQLQNVGDSFDLARGQKLPAKGIVVSIVDRKTVSGIEVFRVKVVRQNSREFIDLYFSTADPYYKNPDIWVDWTGDNGPEGKSSTDPKDAHIYVDLDEPKDQGEKIRVPDSGHELHWMVARVRNIGNVRAEHVKLNFSVCEPPGAGDRGEFKVRDTVMLAAVPPTGRDQPIYAKSPWPIPAGFKGHTCIMVEVADFKVPLDATGVALASDDVWQANNRAQKNVDQIGHSHDSPFDPVEFDFSVNNSGEWPEVAYLEPEGLPYGMQLTVMPKRRKVAAGETAIFRCTLQLDDKVLDASCLGDHDFRINAWRVDQESSIPWGGVEYQVRPRKRTRADLSGSWDWTNLVEISGHVSPGNIVGKVRIRLAYTGLPARWVTADLKPGGTFEYKEKAPAGTSELQTMALFEGNKYYSESRSQEKRLVPPPPVR